MLTKGDRVMVKTTGAYGYITGGSPEQPDAWDVLLDGAREPKWVIASILLPVEVVVLEGELLIFDDSWDGVARVGDKYLSDVLNAGDTVRLTIERVKKEG